MRSGLLLLGPVLFFGSLACSNALADAGKWDVAAGVAPSPTAYFGDRNGAVYSSFTAGYSVGHVTQLRAYYSHASYYDVSAARPATFTPIGLGVRWDPVSRWGCTAYLDVVPTVITTQWVVSPLTEAVHLLGGQVGGGVLLPRVGMFRVQVGVDRLMSGGLHDYSVKDAGPFLQPGLRQNRIQVLLSAGR